MSRVKTFDSTGIDPGGKLYAGDLNAIQDKYADLSNLLQAIGVGQIAVGEAGLIISRFATGVLGVSGAIRAAQAINAVTGFQVNGASLAASHLSDYNTLALKTDLAGTFPPGVIVPYSASAAPTGWLICDGSAISRTTYSALFNILNADGLKYGTGDGSTTFNIPDMRGRVPVGKNSATFNVLGLKAGEETHALVNSEIPAHSHGGVTSSDSAGTPAGTVTVASSGTLTTNAETTEHTHQYAATGGYITTQVQAYTSGVGEGIYHGTSETTVNTSGRSSAHTHTIASHTHTATFAGTALAAHSHTISSDGGSGAHNNLQPYIVTNFIIKT